MQMSLLLGEQAATPLSAVFHFFLRDLTGMLGGISFAFFQASLRFSSALLPSQHII